MPSQKVLESKKAIVQQLADKIKNSSAGVFVDYKGLNVQEDTELRRELRKAGVEYSVVKNTLTKFALKEIGYEGLDDILNGTTALATSADDVVAPAKVLCNFAKKNNKLSIKAGFVEGKVADIAEIEALSKIPSKEDLISKTLYCLISPIQGLAIALKAIADKKSEGGTPAEDTAEVTVSAEAAAEAPAAE